MTSVIIFSILVPLVVVTVVIVYRVERRTERISRVPLSRLAGPDSVRVAAELDALLTMRRDGG
ncbi:hypothetical protein [Gordonia effusa]|uniref:hypothetical protein n=1 Tax=Gordonia effusa TaxID=263908 RepID=UPI00058EB595|nr:hypothetical protein [Gordonia effusa]